MLTCGQVTSKWETEDWSFSLLLSRLLQIWAVSVGSTEVNLSWFYFLSDHPTPLQ